MRGSASCCLWRCWCSGRLRARPPARSPHASLTARSGRSRSPPVPSGPSGALHAGGACVAGVSLGVSSRRRAWSRRCSRAPQLGQRGYCASSTFACNSSVTISVFELASLELQRFWALLKVHAIELRAKFLGCVSVVTCGYCSRVQKSPQAHHRELRRSGPEEDRRPRDAARSGGLVWFCGPGVLRVVGCYWWCCAHWRAYWLGESQPSALWGCSSL